MDGGGGRGECPTSCIKGGRIVLEGEMTAGICQGKHVQVENVRIPVIERERGC